MSNFGDIGFKRGTSTDAFGLARMSLPVTLFEYQNQYNKGTLIWSESVTGSGVATHVANSASVTLSTGSGTDTHGVARQTFDYFRYHAGKSQFVKMTGTFGTGVTNVRKRMGYFDTNNGIYFEQTGTTLNFVIRTYTSGSPVNTTYAQSAWTLDTLGGGTLNPSGITLDITKSFILVMDLQWLGVGSIRFGFQINGKLYYCHEVHNSNLNAGVYMTTANLPIRYEIYNIGAVGGGASTMTQICANVISEGNMDDEIGYKHSVNNGTTAISITTRRAILSIRPKATFNSITNRARILLDSFSILNTGANQVLWEIVYNASLGGSPSWTSAGTNSTVEYDVAGTTITGGEVISSGYMTSVGTGVNSNGGVSATMNSKYPITLDISGANPMSNSIVCTAITGTQTCYGSINFFEFY